MKTRALMPDYLRLIALFGIAVVNVQYMGYPIVDGYSVIEDPRLGDEVAIWLVNGLATTKTYGLFSFMFGVGLAFQMQAAERRAVPFGPVYRRRVLGLLTLGLAHACLLFPYDILVLYAVTGAILYPLRNLTVRTLTRLGIGLVVVQVPLMVGLFLMPTPETNVPELEQVVLRSGTLGEVIALRAQTYGTAVPFLMLFQGFSSLGWFCLGLASVKSGMIDAPGDPRWRWLRRRMLAPGVVLSLIGAALWVWGPYEAGVALTFAAAPFATAGYLGVIAWLARAPGRVMATLLTAGGSSLSIYLGQSIVLNTLFAPFGGGLWSDVSPIGTILMALGVTVALMLAVLLWRRVFALGPFEWVLRRITYGAGG